MSDAREATVRTRAAAVCGGATGPGGSKMGNVIEESRPNKGGGGLRRSHRPGSQ